MRFAQRGGKNENREETIFYRCAVVDGGSRLVGGGNPSHPCVTVYYSKTGKTYDIAEALMEVISESR